MKLLSLDYTQTLATYLVEKLPKGSLLILSGGLGAGKTTLSALIAKTLKSPAKVSSPTYTLIHEYPTPEGLLIHIDAYRLENPQFLLASLDDYLQRSRLVIVEWGEALEESYPEAWRLRLERYSNSQGGLERSATLFQQGKLIALPSLT